MSQIVFERVFIKRLKKVRQKNKRLAKLIDKQLVLFEKDSSHPSLRKHKLKGKLGDYWSISVNESFRLVYVVDGDLMCFVDCGSHDQVYKKR